MTDAVVIPVDTSYKRISALVAVIVFNGRSIGPRALELKTFSTDALYTFGGSSRSTMSSFKMRYILN
jgi:hypothetical protein